MPDAVCGETATPTAALLDLVPSFVTARAVADCIFSTRKEEEKLYSQTFMPK